MAEEKGNIISSGLNLMNTAYNGAGGIVISGDAVKGGYFVTDTIDNIPSWSSVAGTLCYCTADSKFYQYNGSSWQEKEFGGTNAIDSADKLYLVGAKDQTSNSQTYSNSDVYMSNGTLTANNLSTNTLVSQRLSSQLNLKVSDSSDALHDVASFGYYNPGGAYIDVQGHLTLNEAGSHVHKPENKTGLPSVKYADYFNTGITAYGISASSGLPVAYTLSFPGISGTLSTIKYKHNIVLSGSFSTGPGGTAYCTFSFINDSPAAISTLSELDTSLAVRFTNKVCPACGVFGYNSGSSASLYLITGITYDITASPAATRICYNQIAETSSNTMTVAAIPSTSKRLHQYQFSSATVIDTVEEC